MSNGNELDGGQFSRTKLLIGGAGLEALCRARVIVFGVGGVGGFVVEALARAGVGALDIVDSDTVALSNLNRQIIALHSTLGTCKVDAMKARIYDIHPACRVTAHNCFFLPENADSFDFSHYDYVVDAVDTVSAKLEIIKKAKDAHVPVISCMGTGNKFDAMQFHIADISQTSVCPLARVMRQELKKRGIENVKALYSTAKPLANNAPVPASISFVPAVAGLLIAGEVIREITKLTS
ncbi:MAG: tRNA threonylcarbamoyladenosine dehydratase [Treponema sp.]|nr:tRNA threonylcarbamoyladenosine dehydratase [Treponema sp.]